MITDLKPFINISPGQILKREMNSLNWRIEDLAEKSGISRKKINDIIKNKQSIDVGTAKLLGKAFNLSKEFWLNLEQNYLMREKY